MDVVDENDIDSCKENSNENFFGFAPTKIIAADGKLQQDIVKVGMLDSKIGLDILLPVTFEKVETSERDDEVLEFSLINAKAKLFENQIINSTGSTSHKFMLNGSNFKSPISNDLKFLLKLFDCHNFNAILKRALRRQILFYKSSKEKDFALSNEILNKPAGDVLNKGLRKRKASKCSNALFTSIKSELNLAANERPKMQKIDDSFENMCNSSEFRFKLDVNESDLNAAESLTSYKTRWSKRLLMSKSLSINSSSFNEANLSSVFVSPKVNKVNVSASSDHKKFLSRSANSDSAVDKEVWIQRKPIFIADGHSRRALKFPQRNRSTFCFVCGGSDHTLTKCSSSGCNTSFHSFCVLKHVDGGYNYEFMQRNKGIHCPRHHCTGCFADHNRVRCFNGALVRCSQCELAWHPNCIPGGCEINSKLEIICPRHVVYSNPDFLHTTHCADCQQKNSLSERFVRCYTCLRSFHEKCYLELVSWALPPNYKMYDDGANFSENDLRCNWCRSYDYVRYGQYCMGRLGASKWYPCQVVSNKEYPRKKDPNLYRVGFMAVKWLPYRNKIFYNLITHNRVLPMTEKDYFFVTEAHNSNIYEEWSLAQKYTLENCPENSIPKPDQINQHFSNGERYRKITRCKYTSPELRLSKNQIHTADLCRCPVNMPDRCGPSSTCINRALRIECPKLCELKGKCANRMISSGNNCVKVSIEPYGGRYFGAVTLEDIPENGFVGEYVGEIITHEEKQHRIERIARMRSIEAQYYIMDLDSHRAIDAMYYGNDMRYVNHSCQPNCLVQVIWSEVDKHLVLVALRNIKKGEELSFDYNMYSTNSGRDVPKCHCNAVNCSGILSATGSANAKDSLPKKKSLIKKENSSADKSKTTIKSISALKKNSLYS